MTNEPDLDAFDRDLRALLRVEPSEGFMAGVRARLEKARPARSPWWWLAPALAAGLAAAFLARAAARTTPAPANPPRAVAVAPPAPSVAAPSAAARAAPVPRPAAPRVRRERPLPEVIVPPDAERALLAFVAAANARARQGAATLTASTSDAPLDPPMSIDIAPLDDSPLPEPTGPRGSSTGTRSDS